MALDNGYHIAPQALQTSIETACEAPLSGASRQSLKQRSSSPFSNYGIGSFTPAEDLRLSREHGDTDLEIDGRYDSRDTRRLTPNLGISFVSQIHSLKKELESKDSLIGNLEESLHQSRAENEQLNGDLSGQMTEVRSVKQQMSSLEHDMLQALEDIAKDRDAAVKSVDDHRKYLEASKRKVRAQEEEAEKAYLTWEKEKQDWENNKRKMESKVHVVEERLKTMVGELMAVQGTEQNRPGADYEVDEGMRETWFVKGNDVRAASRLSNRSIDDHYENQKAATFRSSRMSGLHDMGGSQMSGLSLADELEMEGHDDDDVEQESVLSPDALPEELHMMQKRYSEDMKARKIMGLHTDSNDQNFGDEIPSQHSVGIIKDYINLPTNRTSVIYTDTATQFTPPATLVAHKRGVDSMSEGQFEQTEHSANQSQKQVPIPSIFVDLNPLANSQDTKALPMISTGCQTDDIPQGLPRPVNQNDPVEHTSKTQMRSSATQTNENTASVSKSASTRHASAPLDVPVIEIHPPASRPPSSHNGVVLPPRTKNAGCQVAIEMPRSLRSISMQTEEIRVDKRLVRIPPRLNLSNPTIKTHPRSTERRTRTCKPSIPDSSKRHIRGPPLGGPDKSQASATHIAQSVNQDPVAALRSVKTLSRPSVVKFEQAKERQYENSDPKDDRYPSPRRPSKAESVCAEISSKIEDDTIGLSNDFSDDDDFANAAPIRKTLSKVQNSWKLVPQLLEPASEEAEDFGTASSSRTTVPKVDHLTQVTLLKTKSIDGHQATSSTAKPTDIRRQALSSNGVANHAQRPRSPSASNAPSKEAATVAPPFPVPTRSSSRKIPISASEGAASPTPHTTSFFTTRRGQNHGKPPIKNKMLRKVQSAAAVSKPPAPRRPPPPFMSASSTVPGSPKFLPPTQNQFVFPLNRAAEMSNPSTVGPESRPHAGEASIETPNQQTSVVDAIAQTMVGEWMWKYVRKRTSFGITESPQAEFEMSRNGETGSGSGVRHKRWVWLAPYENAVIWSSKQPTSGPALLGKGGRKLMIQSVLDVRDDTPLPKNAGSQSVYDRSILILTPQRALKFTAVSRERHYIWLTALSFLSHSTRGMDDLASPPPLPPREYPLPLSQDPNASFRRTSVRDSIKIAKDRSRPSLGAHSFSSPIGGVEQKAIQDVILSLGDGEVESEDAAEPPLVPRVASHARKRSNTGPRPVPLSAFHSYPTNSTVPTSSSSLTAPTSRDKYDRFNPSVRGASRSGPSTIHTTTTRRVVTDPNRDSYIAPPPIVPDNFFDPIGTMRMEAFVRNSVIENQVPEVGKEDGKRNRKESRSYRTKQGRKKDMSYWGVGELTGSREDPFTGF